jgi:hypothetical protein
MSSQMIEFNGVAFSVEQVKALSKQGVLNIGQKNDPAGNSPTSAPLQGVFPGNPNMFGMFSDPGVRPERFSAMQRPRTMARLLRPERSEFVSEKIGIVTGQTAGTTTNATGWCEGGALPGVLKTCQQLYPLGKFKMRTRVMLVQEAGMLRNRADIPGIILNQPPQDNPLVPDLLYRLTSTQSVLQTNLFELGVQVERSLEKELFQGVVGTDTSIPGFWVDFNSISSLVKTGYTDVVSGLACPAADSIVVAWNADVGGTVAGRNIVQAITDTVWALKMRAEAVGMGGTQFAIVMSMEQFRALTQTWVCQYYTSRCLAAGVVGAPFVTDASMTRQLETDMMNGQYLLIDGVPHPVIFSDGIPLEQLGGGAAPVLRSDIFILPVSWNGRSLLKLEYQDMGNVYAKELADFIINDSMLLNNGLYLMTKQMHEGCIDLTLNSMMRFYIETPWLAARIDDVSFTYQAQTHVADPGTTFLYANGGISYRTA